MTDSEGERLFFEALDRFGLPPPSGVHHPYGSERAGFWADMDAYWEEIKLNVEIDHVATHGWATDIESDRARDNGLVAEGVTVLRITHAQLRDALPKTMSNLAETMRRLYAETAAREGQGEPLDAAAQAFGARRSAAKAAAGVPA